MDLKGIHRCGPLLINNGPHIIYFLTNIIMYLLRGKSGIVIGPPTSIKSQIHCMITFSISNPKLLLILVRDFIKN